MGSIISSIAHERSWRIDHLLQQWLDMRGIVNLFIRQVKSDDRGGSANLNSGLSGIFA
jgi:hypothetical protein